MSETSRMLQIARVDLSYFFRTKWLLATLIGLNVTDMLVVGIVYGGMTGTFVYFTFFVPGVIVTGLFFASFDVGRRVHLGLTEGVSQYYLTLPVSLNRLVAAHLLSAGVGGVIYAGILTVIAAPLMPSLVSIQTLVLIPYMFVLSMGLAGVAAVMNLFSTAGERYWVITEGVQTTLVALSTVAYPISVVQSYFPSFLVSLIELNPLSQGAEALRVVAGSGAGDPSFSLLGLFVTSLVMMGIGVYSYRRVFTKLREVGKI